MESKQSVIVNRWALSGNDFERYVKGLKLHEQIQLMEEIECVYKVKKRFIKNCTKLLMVGWANFILMFAISERLNLVLVVCFIAPVLGQLLWFKERNSMLIWQNLFIKSKSLCNIY
jgi:hypothetical protein